MSETVACGIINEAPNMQILLFLLISITSSILFLGCHVICSYIVNEEQSMNRPMIMYQEPWIGTVAGITSIIVFISLPINGWFIAKWLGVISLPVFWFITNPFISFSFEYKNKGPYSIIRNPFIHFVFGGIAWIVLTTLNLIIA